MGSRHFRKADDSMRFKPKRGTKVLSGAYLQYSEMLSLRGLKKNRVLVKD